MAATSKGIRAGKAYVELSADDSKLRAGLKAAQARLQAWGGTLQSIGTKVAAVGAAMVTPFVAAGRYFSTAGDAMAKMARRTGLTTEAVSELAFAAELSGTSMEALDVGIRNMQKTVGGPTEATFYRMAQEIQAIQDPADRAAKAMEVFGRSGTALIPLLMDGAAGLETMRQQARALGLTLRKEDAAAAELLNDALGAMTSTLKQIAFQVGAAVAPAMINLSGRLSQVAVKVGDWVRANRQAIVAAFAAGVAVTGLGVAVAGLGVAMKAGALGIAMVSAAASVALSPLVLMAAGIAAVGAAIVTHTQVGAAALEWLGARFGELARYASETWRGMADALAAGSISQAANVLWVSLKLAWHNGTTSLSKIWSDVLASLVKTAWGGFSGVMAAGEYIWHGLQVGWIESIAAIKSALSSFYAWFQKLNETAWNTLMRGIILAEESVGRITPEEAESRRKYLDDSGARATRDINAGRDSEKRSIEQQRTSARDAELKRSDERLAEIGRRYNDIAAAADDLAGEERKRLEAELAAAREARNELLASVGKMTAGAGFIPPQAKTVFDYDDMLAGAGRAVAKTSVAGAFGADSARLGASGGKLEQEATKQRELQEKTLAVLKEMLRKTTGYAVVG